MGSDFLITMGFGLHVGWAIEGAVGSSQKIDATYLSPTVNMAARLETATRQYGVQLLMSHHFYELLGEYSKDRCRLVDRVALKGSAEPMGLVTYEMGDNAREIVKDSNLYYTQYIEGNWEECKKSLETFRATYPQDGPSRTIWGVLEATNFTAPADWHGYRKLSSK